MDFRSGIEGKAVIGAAELPITNWSVNPAATIQEFRNSLTGRFSLKESTYKNVTGSITIDYDFDANPFEAPITIDAGVTLTGVKLYLAGTGGEYWDFPSIIVESTPQSLDVDGKIQTTFNFSNDGEYGTPGNPVA